MTSLLGRYTKQPSETLDYKVDFTDWFADRTDAPSSAAVTVETGLTLVGSSLSGNVVTIAVSGGVDGTSYKVTVLLTTTSAIVREADFVVAVREI